MLLSMVQRTGGPTAKNSLAPNVKSAEDEKSRISSSVLVMPGLYHFLHQNVTVMIGLVLLLKILL